MMVVVMMMMSSSSVRLSFTSVHSVEFINRLMLCVHTVHKKFLLSLFPPRSSW